LAEQPRHPDREEVGLAGIGEVDGGPAPPAVPLEHDARVLERAARLALAQEGAVQVALICLLDLGVGDQVVEEVGAADGVDVLVRLRPELVLDLAPDVPGRQSARSAERTSRKDGAGVSAGPEPGRSTLLLSLAAGTPDAVGDHLDVMVGCEHLDHRDLLTGERCHDQCRRATRTIPFEQAQPTRWSGGGC
jgi:hypothetical protein